MNALRTTVIEQVLSDFRARADDPASSLICRHLAAEHAASFRIRARELWNRGDDAEIIRFVAEALLHEGRFQKLHVAAEAKPLISIGRSLPGGPGGRKPLGDPANEQARRRMVGKETRDALRRIVEAPDERLKGRLSPDETRRILDAMIDEAPRGHACMSLMEHRLDARAKDRALGSEAERKRLDAIMEAKAPHLDGRTESAAYRAVIEKLLVDEAREWLTNAGCSVRDGRIDGIVRTKDVPVNLVELCLPEIRDDAVAENLATAQEALELYRLLDTESEVRRFAIVPLEIDPMTGAGLYILGTGFFTDDLVSWLYPNLDRRRARAARRLRAENPNDRANRRLHAEAFELELSARKRKMIGARTCILALITHAETLDAFTKARVSSAGLSPEETKERRLITGLHREEIDIWPTPVTTVEAMERVLSRFRNTVRCGDGANKRALDAYKDLNEEAPTGCPERFLPYFHDDGPWK